MTQPWRQIAAAVGFLAVAAVGSRIARAEDEQNGRQLQRLSDALVVQLDEQHYRIGIKCSSASEILHAQLPDLPKDQGLVVEEVIVKSPAAKAGIKEHDILITANDKPLVQPADLTGLIEAGKGAEVSVELLRGGKLMSLTVKPEQEKALADRVHLFDLAPEGVNVSEPRVDLNGKALNWTANRDLPDDMSVNVFREGKKPAKITVKKGAKTWEVTESELDKLPEDIRRDVEPLVGGTLRINLKDLSPSFTGPTVGDVFGARPGDLEDRVEKRLDEMNKEMNKRLDEMRATIDRLRNERKGQEPEAEKR